MRGLLLGLLAVLWAGAAVAADKLDYGPAPDWVTVAEIPAPGGEEAGATQVLLRDTQVRLREDGSAETYTRGVLRVRTAQGLAAAGNIALAWNPETDAITIHALRIIRDGEVIDVLGRGASFTVLRRESNLEQAMLDGVLTATIQPPGLQIGDIVDLAFTMVRRDPVLRGKAEFLTGGLADGPVRQMRVRALWPKGRAVRWRVSGDGFKPKITRRGELTEALIEQADVQPPKLPNDAPGRYADIGYFELTEFAAWGELSTLLAPYYQAAAELAPDSPLKAEAARIRAQSSDPAVQAAAALRLVQDKVRYVFLGMEGGYVPAAADLTWSRRFGDCKGKSALLVALLRELGIPAEAALVNVSRSDGLDTRLPMMSDFDHVIVRAVIGGQVYWLDGARRGDRLLDERPTGAYRWGLPVRAAGAGLEKLPQPPSPRPILAIDFDFDASAGLDVPAPVRGVVTMRGDSAIQTKGMYDELTGAQREESLRGYWKGDYDWIEVSAVSAEFDEATGEFRLVMQGMADMDWSGPIGSPRRYEADGAHVGWKADFKRDPGPQQAAPFAVGYPWFVQTREKITLPRGGEGFSVVGADVDSTVGVWKLRRKTALAKGVFTMDVTMQSLQPELAYDDAQEAAKTLSDLGKVRVFVQAPGGYAPTEAEIRGLAARTPKTADDFIDRGAAYLAADEMEKARDDFAAAIGLDPASALAYADRAVAFFWLGEVGKAQVDADMAISLDPREPIAFNARGLVAASQGDYQKAVDAFSRSAQLAPDSDFPLYRRAAAYEALGEDERALADLAEVRRRNPNDGEAYDARALLLIRTGKLVAALSETDDWAARLPDDTGARLRRGHVLLAMQRRSEALAVFDALVAQAPTAEAYLWRAQAYEPEARDKAYADLDRALKLDPKSLAARQVMARLKTQERDFEGAIKVMDEALRLDPKDADALTTRISALLKLKRFDLALADADRLLADEPGQPGALNQRCWVRAVAGVELEKALADCDAALKARKDFAAALDSRGLVYLRQGRMDESIADYDAALALQPKYGSSFYGRGVAKLRKGLKTEGEADLAAARAISPEVDTIYAAYGIQP